MGWLDGRKDKYGVKAGLLDVYIDGIVESEGESVECNTVGLYEWVEGRREGWEDGKR